MKRAAIYARYSTDHQNEKSCEDQIALCRSVCGHEGFSVVAEFSDAARSGTSMMGRDDLQKLLELASRKGFDVLVVEDFDRLARSMVDLPTIYKGLRFQGIQVLSANKQARWESALNWKRQSSSLVRVTLSL